MIDGSMERKREYLWKAVYQGFFITSDSTIMGRLFTYPDGFFDMISKRYFLACTAVLFLPFLASCSTLTDGSTQRVSFKTIGAENAYCDILLGDHGYKYSVHPPQTISIQRSRKPMFIACTAPGNRAKDAVIESGIANTAYLNTLTLGLTLPWDASTGAMYEYPEEVVIDFSGSLSKVQPLPSYHNKGTLDPQAQGIEFLGPDTPALETDSGDRARYKAAYDEAARQEAEEAANTEERERRMNALEGGFYGDKGRAPESQSVPQGSSEESSPKDLKLGKPIFPSSTSF